MKYHCWKVGKAEESAAKRLCAEVGISVLAAKVLLSRGITTAERAIALLEEDCELSDPFLMKDMEKAVQRIHSAIDSQEKIVVFGDYDVDGVTATALLFTHLANMGANVRCMLPSREGDGYGLSVGAVDKLERNGYKLVITVDNGISAAKEIAYAKEKGIDVIVTDHHIPPEEMPPAFAVIDAARPDDTSPFKLLSGVGVAFKLAAALEGCMPEELLDFYADLAAIGTVADVVPLVGENRALVKHGLQLMNQQARPGIDALIREAGMDGRTLAAENIAFTIAPRLNAAGRMDDATAALRLLITEEEEPAEQLAQRLCAMNTDRQNAEQAIMEEVHQQLEKNPALLAQRVLVIWSQSYHPGVTGIAASRMVEKYGKPTILISLSDGEGKGSGRSIKGFHLHHALAACSDHLLRYGGHELAAGLSIEESKLEAFRAAINKWAAEECPVMQLPPLELDTTVKLDRLTAEDVQSLDLLAPFGAGNPSPLFLLQNVMVDGVYPMSDGKHSRLRLRQGNAGIYAAWFGYSPEKVPYQAGSVVDVALALSVYEGKNGAQLSGRIKEIRPANLSEEHTEQSALFDSFCSGKVLTPQEKELLCPAREDTVNVYQQIRSGGVSSLDQRPLFARLGQIHAGKILTSLAALEQLKLIDPDLENGWYKLVPSKEKKDLQSAKILQQMK